MTSVDRIRDYIASRGIKKSEFYQRTNLSNGYIDKVRELGADKIESIVSAFPELNLYWLVTGKGDMLMPAEKKAESDKNSSEAATGFSSPDLRSPTLYPALRNANKRTGTTTGGMNYNIASEPKTEYEAFQRMPRVITVNENMEENIVYVPVKARAGYLTGYGDTDFIGGLPTLRLPGLNNGTYRMFEVEGPSMAPNIMSGDRVIGQWVSSFGEIRENRVHVVVCKDGVVVKRVLNRIQERGKLVLKSDTINHRKEYPTYEVSPEDVLEIWYCRLKLSSDFAEPAEVYHRLADLEAEMTDVRAVTKQFGETLTEIRQQIGNVVK